MTVRLDVAEVVTPTEHMWKAKATIEGEHLVVKDRRSGAVLVDVTAPVTQTSSTTWQVGEDVQVIKQNTCGCGGTRVIGR